MNKTILIACILMSASLVQAEVLSWRVDIPDANGANGSYTTARLFATTLGAGDNYSADRANAQSVEIARFTSTYGVLRTDTTLTVGSGYNFYVVLYNGGSEYGYSALKDWNTLVSDGSLVSGVAPALPATTVWNALPVPEPTSMALLAMGVSALLLRRKRVV